jgi:hypothetical protein
MKIIIIIGIMALVVIGTVVLVGVILPLPPTINSDLPTNEVADSFTTADGRSLAWRGGAVNQSQISLSPSSQAIQVVYLGPARESVVEVRTSGPELGVKLQSPSGQIPAITPDVALDKTTGEIIRIYKILNQTESGAWEVITTNSGLTTGTANVTTPIANPPLEITPSTPPVAPPGQGVVISLTVEQSGGSSGGDIIIKTVSDVTVTVTVMDPSGNETIIALIEDPNNPGTYVGTYPGGTEPGVYEVKYVIIGTEDGQEFTQITTGQFVVTNNQSSATGTPTGNTWQKKYDINRSNEINIIGY